MMPSKERNKSKSKYPIYEIEKEAFRDFFLSDEIYSDQIKSISENKSSSFTLQLSHASSLNDLFLLNTKTYVRILYEVIDNLVFGIDYEEKEKEKEKEKENKESNNEINHYLLHRSYLLNKIRMLERKSNENKKLDENSDLIILDSSSSSSSSSSLLSPSLIRKQLSCFLRNYTLKLECSFSSSIIPTITMRDLKSDRIGSMVQIKGMVMRKQGPTPYLKVATYICSGCGKEYFQPNYASSFKPIKFCMDSQCKTTYGPKELFFQTSLSRYEDFAKLTLQEFTEEMKVGQIPRSICLHVYGDLTRHINVSDKVFVQGIFLLETNSHKKTRRASLSSTPYIEVTNLEKCTKVDKEASSHDLLLSENINEKKLIESIAPEIYGLYDFKKSLLLAMLGGSKCLKPDITFRPDINVLALGDPGLAKSQLMKFVSGLSDISVYTNSTGSSGVGLTASIGKDHDSGEFYLQAGAMVLADEGVCLLDEFDKMKQTDQTAIHEVMEQQTVSISKAGITASLKARVTVIAAGNSVFGRWDVKKPLFKNASYLTAALKSRFDLIWILLDEPNEEKDEELARHICSIHMLSSSTKSSSSSSSSSSTFSFKNYYSKESIKKYIRAAKNLNPTFDSSLHEVIQQHYVSIRNDQYSKDQKQQKKNTNERQEYCSIRTLLTFIRLSQANAKLHLREVVTKADVEEAIRMYYQSLSFSVVRKKNFLKNKDEQFTYLYDKIRNVDQFSWKEIEQSVFYGSNGKITKETFKEFVEEYIQLGIFVWSNENKLMVEKVPPEEDLADQLNN